MKVWIIEDEYDDENKAKRAVKEACGIGNPQVNSSMKIPPDFLNNREDNFPHIVILDLQKGDEPDLKESIMIYDTLREEERKAQRVPGAFIIVWSKATGLDKAQKFFDKNKTDRYFIYLPIKSERRLRQTLENVVEKLREIGVLP